MLKIPTEEIHHSIFDAGKSFLKGEPVLQILLLLGLGVGAMFLKNYMESIRETKPQLLAILLILVCLFTVFAVFMWISELKS